MWAAYSPFWHQPTFSNYADFIKIQSKFRHKPPILSKIILLFNFRSQNELLEVVVGCITEEKREISISDIISNQLNALFSKIFKGKFSFEVFFYRQQVNKELKRYICTTLMPWTGRSWNFGEKWSNWEKKYYTTSHQKFCTSIVVQGVQNSIDKKFTR